LPEVKALSGHFSPLTGKSSSVHMKRIMWMENIVHISTE
jgi:hypothetical protein